ncbi:hypothetical protein [Methyloceanibacter sp.]|uniref:hypothetical protein n=1 Tax=Methyloceanibacter sp. TaxID=1965321 RepID=UPI003D6D503A
MSETALHVEVDGDIIIVMDPATRYYALYTKPSDRAEMLAHGHAQHLTLLRCRPTKDRTLLDAAYQAASAKARELGWIV